MADVHLSIAGAEVCPPAEQDPTPPEYQDDERPEVKLGWRIQGEAEADWALQKMSEHEAQVASIDRQLAAAIARETRRADALKANASRGVAFFEAVLMEYGERSKRLLLGTGKKKSHAFLHGTIGWRKTGGKLAWTNEDLALEWAKKRPVEEGLVRIVCQLEKAEIQKLAKAKGIVPPGTELQPVNDEVYVTAAKVEE